MQMVDLKFKECENCSSKCGIPLLCEACQHNRKVISYYGRALMEEQLKLRKVLQVIGYTDS